MQVVTRRPLSHEPASEKPERGGAGEECDKQVIGVALDYVAWRRQAGRREEPFNGRLSGAGRHKTRPLRAGKLFERSCSTQGVAFPGNDSELMREQWLQGERSVTFTLRPWTDAEVERPVSHEWCDILRKPLDDSQLNTREVVAERCHCLGNDEGAYCGPNPETHGSFCQCAFCDLILCLLQFRVCGAHASEKRAPAVRQRNALRGSLQELGAQICFKSAHAASDRRLRNAQHACGAANAAALDYRKKILELLQAQGDTSKVIAATSDASYLSRPGDAQLWEQEPLLDNDVSPFATKPHGRVRPLGSRWCLAALLIISNVMPALAQGGYPSRTIRIVVPNSAGGTADTVARLLAQGLTESLGRQVLVENRPGAGTIIGTEIVARASADGYTLLMSPSTLAINPASYKKLPYDALRDFSAISQIASVPSVMVVHPSVPAKSVKELIALAKAHPGELLYASPGHGTIPHLTMELFASMARIRMVHVPYKGAAPARLDVIAGRVETTTVIAYVPDGKLRALGVTSARRSAAAPDIPTIAEAGLPGFELVQWYGLLAPAGTNREIVARLHKDSITVLHAADMKNHLAKTGGDVVASSPGEFAVFLKTEIAKMASAVKAAGIQPE